MGSFAPGWRGIARGCRARLRRVLGAPHCGEDNKRRADHSKHSATLGCVSCGNKLVQSGSFSCLHAQEWFQGCVCGSTNGALAGCLARLFSTTRDPSLGRARNTAAVPGCWVGGNTVWTDSQWLTCNQRRLGPATGCQSSRPTAEACTSPCIYTIHHF